MFISKPVSGLTKWFFHFLKQINGNPELSCVSQQLELKNVDLRAGDQLKIKGMILHDAER